MKLKASLATVALSTLLLSACSATTNEADGPGEVTSAPGTSSDYKDPNFDNNDGHHHEDGHDHEAEEEIAAEPRLGVATVAVGETVAIGDWTVKVKRVVQDASNLVATTNEFNEKAKHQYVLVIADATYVGKAKSSSVSLDLTWMFSGSDEKVYDPVVVVTPKTKDGSEVLDEIPSGTTTELQLAFDVPAQAIKAGVVSAEAYNKDFESEFADYGLN